MGNDKYEGYCADLAKKIAEIITIQYKIVPVKDGKYGEQDANSSWNGIVGEVVRNVSGCEQPELLAVDYLWLAPLCAETYDTSSPVCAQSISCRMHLQANW